MPQPTQLKSVLLGFLASFIVFGMPLQAQESQADIQSKESSRDLLRKQMEMQLQQQEKLLPPESDDLGEQIIVKRKPKAWSITLATDIGETWSSNVLQSETQTQADFAITQNDMLNASYKLYDGLTLSGSYRFSMYRYNRLVAQNFDAHNASGSFSYTLPYNLNLGGGVGWTTIYSKPIADSVYEEADFNGTLSRVIPLEFNDWFKQHTAAFVGYQVDYRLASPKDLDKLENAPYAGFFCALNQQLNGQLMYR